MLFYIEIADEVVERLWAIEDPLDRVRNEAAVQGAIDREVNDLRRRIMDWAIGNAKETV